MWILYAFDTQGQNVLLQILTYKNLVTVIFVKNLDIYTQICT